jgi:hypothetical protein
MPVINQRALSVSVYRNEQYKGCSMDGVSEKFNELLVLCKSGNVEVDGTEPNLCKVVRREIYDRVVYHIEPVANPGAWYSFGGAFAYSCDSRFAEMVGHQYGAISIHDRVE